MSGALFGSAATGNRSTGKNLVEFRAGKMTMKGTTVTPDKRKGQVYVHQSDDSLMHFCWKDRGNGVVEDDLIIFPDDCEFKAVQQCTTGRVFVLKFKSSSRKFFFWMQEPKKDKDDEYCKKVNEMLNNPPAPGSSGGGGRSGGLPPELAGLGASLGEGGLQNVLGNMDQQQLMQLLNSGGLGGMGGLGALGGLIGAGRPPSSHQSSSSTGQSRAQSSPAVHSHESSSSTSQPSQTPTAATTKPKATTTNTTTTTASATASATTSTTATAKPTPTPTNQSVQLSDLQTILNTMNIPNPDGAAGAEGVPQQPPIDLNKVLTSEAMAPILAKPEVQEKLIAFLPEGESLPRDPEQLRQTLKSPQFKQALNMFTAAFQSGQLGPLMGQFGLGSEAAEAANKGDLEAFGKALQKQSGGEKMETEAPKDGSDKPKDEEEGMNLD